MEYRYRVVNVDRDSTIRRATLELANAAADAMRLAGERAIVVDAEAMAPAEVPNPAALGPEPVRIKDVARICREANRGMCAALGDDSQLPWDEAPDWQRESCIAGVRAIWENCELTPMQLHEQWAERKRAEGWVYGDVKDAEAKTHPCLVDDYYQLPVEQRAKDNIFRAVALAMLGLPGKVAEPLAPNEAPGT